MFQAKLGQWKRFAAGLVLVPGLGGICADEVGLIGRASAQDRPAATSRVEDARELMRQAQEAYNAKNYGRAKELAEKAKSMRTSSAFYDQTPDELLADIQRKSGGRPTGSRTPTDAKSLVGMAKEALDRNELDRAEDLAKQASSNAANVRWGLFDDTPASVLKDVQKAKARRDRDQSEKLLAEARMLVGKKANSATERAANLTAAEEKARMSEKLHGEYSVWHLGDKPSSVLADIRSIRNKEDLPATSARPRTDTAPMMERTEPVRNDRTERPSADTIVRNDRTADTGPMAAKTKAVRLMAEANAARQSGNLGVAKAKLIEASRLNAPFGAEEDTPESELARLNAYASQRINELARSAKSHKERDEARQADLKLAEAEQLAAMMGFDAGALADLRVSARKPAVRTPVEDPSGIVAPPIAPPPMDVGAPRIINGSGSVRPVAGIDDAAPAPAPVKPQVVERGSELLKSARLELQRGDTEAARKICLELISGPQYTVKAEAQALLNSVEAEESSQKALAATRAYESGLAAYNAHQYDRALSIFKQIDQGLLNSARRSMLADMMTSASSRQRTFSSDATMIRTGADEAPPMGNRSGTTPIPPATPMTPPAMRLPAELPGPAPIAPKTGADNLLRQTEALSAVEFQRLRTEALKIESEATARFGRGETDAALQDLQNFVNRVKAANLDPSKQALLTRPVEARMERLRILKHQTDFLAKEARQRRDFRSEMTQEALQRQSRQEEVAKLLKTVDRLSGEAKYAEAFAQAQMAQQLDPDDAAVNATLKMAERAMRLHQVRSANKSLEELNFRVLTELKEVAPVTDRDPLAFSRDPEARRRFENRMRNPNGVLVPRSKTDKDREIERKLSTSVTVNFKAMPLESVVDHLQQVTGINFDLDRRALKEAGIDDKQPITKQLNDISLKNALNILFRDAGLKFAVENEAVRVSTVKGIAGRQVVKSIAVGDLVVPAPNYKTDPVFNFTDQLRRASGLGNLTPESNSNSAAMRSGTPVGDSSVAPNGYGRLINQPGNGYGPAANLSANGTLEKELIRLITSTVKPDSWNQLGGEGSVEYYPLGLALVINQSPEVIEEVERLLDSLRKLQDLEVSIEVKVVSLAETFYERIGVDFAMGVKTNGQPLAQGAANTPNRVTSRNFGGNVIGLQAPGVPTPDLDIPIRATSFGRAIPPFGGFGNDLGGGGLALGLAFLSDIQVQMFLEAAQGDTRTNVMQAPKLTTLNGTSAELSVGDVQFFVTGVQVTSVNGQLVFTPQNVPFQVGIAPQPPQSPFNPVPPLQQSVPGITLNIQPVVSADRRFVRLNISQGFQSLISGTQQVPLTTIITPVFDNGGQGQPVPFTQFLQQPRFSNIGTQTVVVVPDGGTVVMGGLKYMTEGRNEFGPPVLSKIPYINRLFKNVAYGREGRSILIMVTPRIIINREEQEKQTGLREEDLGQ